MSDRSVFWSRPRQSNKRTLELLDLKNRVTSFRRLVLGAKQPVISHINSQPRSSLILQHTITISAQIVINKHLKQSNLIVTEAVMCVIIVISYKLQRNHDIWICFWQQSEITCSCCPLTVWSLGSTAHLEESPKHSTIRQWQMQQNCHCRTYSTNYNTSTCTPGMLRLDQVICEENASVWTAFLSISVKAKENTEHL